MCCTRLAGNTGRKKIAKNLPSVGQFGAPQQISMCFASWQRYCTALYSGRQWNFAALSRGCHLYSAGRPSRWALAHILVLTDTISGMACDMHHRKWAHHRYYSGLTENAGQDADGRSWCNARVCTAASAQKVYHISQASTCKLWYIELCRWIILNRSFCVFQNEK